MSASKLAIRQGSSALYFILPIATTSIAKIAPVTGVPKTAPNPAATPHISKMLLSLSFKASHLENKEAILPPICTAVPSRPADPPNKCVTRVATKTIGAMRTGTPAPG